MSAWFGSSFEKGMLSQWLPTPRIISFELAALGLLYLPIGFPSLPRLSLTALIHIIPVLPPHSSNSLYFVAARASFYLLLKNLRC